MKRVIFICAGVFLISACTRHRGSIGETEITKWQYGKKAAVSITYDDGSINQFRIAMPIMNRLNIPATFFIITGQIPGSRYQSKFIGRPIGTIIEETATIPTNKENFLERSSAAGFLGFRGTREYHTNAGIKIDAGKPEEAYKIIDELYRKVRNGEFRPESKTSNEQDRTEKITWDDVRTYAAQGHEFASHTVSHPYLSALDDVNMQYELEKSREDILVQLGQKYTFSATIPYATDEERVMENAYKIYPAIRTRQSDDFAEFVEEITSSKLENPDSIDKEYVKWQCRAFTRSSLLQMKLWIDTAVENDNIWVVLIFHGVDGIGYEPLTSEVLDEYFQYMKSKDNDLWIATFGDATKYIHERINSTFNTAKTAGKLTVSLSNSLDKTIYDIPLTLKTYVSSNWSEVQVKQGGESKRILPQRDAGGSYVIYQAYADSGDIELSGD